MPKKPKENYSNEAKESKEQQDKKSPEEAALAKLPPDVQEKLKAIKSKLEKFQKKVMEKFDKYIVGIALLPPPKPAQMPQQLMPQAPSMPQIQMPPGSQPAPADEKDKIHVLILVDDSDSQKMPKQELKDKLTTIINSMALEIDKNFVTQTVILSELWQNCYDGKYDLLQLIAMSASVFDKGMLQAIRIAEIHKTMVLKKFEKYIVSYVLAGSLVQGRATPTSDIDVWIVIDDTDVKKMTRVELKDKLRAIIIGMGIEAGELTGVRNKINIQVYILTDFWDSLREANPVIFTLLRDGVPFYDRGIFMPWKQLLKMGKIKPSAEAIDLFMGSGEQVLRRVKLKLNEIGMEDTYYATLTPSQAALMHYGIPPPAPKETAEVMREVFVKKEKMLEEKFIRILETNIQIRKAIEHGDKKELTGREIDQLMDDADKYLKRIKRLFTQIERIREDRDMVSIYDTVSAIARDALRAEGIEKVSNEDLLKMFEHKLVSEGKVPTRQFKTFEGIIRAKKDYDEHKLSKIEMEHIFRDSGNLIKSLVEYVQRKRGAELERAKIRVKYGSKYGEVMLLDTHAFVVHDIDAKDKEISKARVKPNGSLEALEKSSHEEMEKHIASVHIPQRAFIKEPIFEELKKIFGPDVEVLVNY
ncbi:nucleotidyltransferase domain-containing protein [Candidatus Woesearchaeota archaeon]|nr:nucleotidyltransferase domain-containing protein [Candidatus Woesearchaeota archaeon]